MVTPTPPPNRHFCAYVYVHVYFLSIFVFADFSGLPMLWFPVHPLITIPASGALQPTNQLSARHHIFSAINSKFNWRKNWTCLFKICFLPIDRDQSTEGILVQTFKRPTLAKWQKKRKGSPVRGRWPMFTSILLVKEERDHDLFIKKREGCLMGNWLEEESVRLPTSQIFRLLRWTEIWQLCEI